MTTTQAIPVSPHRYVCPARPPRLWTDPSPEIEALVGGRFGHQHACIHDDRADTRRAVEHECSCGMTWIEYPTRTHLTLYKPAPPKRSWSIRRWLGGRR